MTRVETVVGSLLLWDQDDLTRWFAAHPGGFWDAHLKQALDDTPPGGWAIDLGAHVGFFTRYLAQRFRHVLAIEAHPATCQLLRQNVRSVGLKADRVTIVWGAAYDRPNVTLGFASAAVHGWPAEPDFAVVDQARHAAGFTFVEDPLQWHPVHHWSVPTVRVDDLVPEEVRVAVIKSDVQGADLRALRGADRVIQRDRPRIIFEYEGAVSQIRGDDWPDYERFFADRDYRLTPLPGPSVDYLAEPQ